MQQYKIKKTDAVIRAVCCILIGIVFSLLFYFQAVEYNDAYPSDLPTHIKYAVEGRGYSFLYFLIGVLVRLTKSNVSVAILGGSLMVAAFLITEKYLKQNLLHRTRLTIVLAVCLLFLCSTYIPYVFPFFYTNALITQPWHNITYIGMRPFALLAYFATTRVLRGYRENFSWKAWFSIAVPLLISAGIKPNFLITYCFSLLFVLVYDFVRDIWTSNLSVSRFKNYVFLGSVVFPSLIVLIMQSRILYGTPSGGGASSGLALALFSSSFFRKGMAVTAIKVARDLAFPVLIWIYAGKSFTREDKFAYLQFVITLLLVIVLKETGPRASHGNFYWGLYLSSYILYACLFSKFIKIMQEGRQTAQKPADKCFAFAGTVLMTWYTVSGIIYFAAIFCGNYYLI